MKVEIILIILVFSILSCDSKEKDFDFDFFSVRERSLIELKKHKFSLNEGHVVVFEKTFLTTDYEYIRLYYVVEDSRLESRTIELNIKRTDSISLNKIFNKFKSKAISNIDKTEYGRFSLLVENENGQIFECNYNKERSYNFSITYSYDKLTREKIKEIGYWGSIKVIVHSTATPKTLLKQVLPYLPVGRQIRETLTSKRVYKEL